MKASRRPKPSIALPAEARQLLEDLIARGVTTEEIATGSDASGSLIRRMRRPENTGGRQAVRAVVQTLVTLAVERTPDLVRTRAREIVALGVFAKMDQSAATWAALQALADPDPAVPTKPRTARRKRAKEEVLPS